MVLLSAILILFPYCLLFVLSYFWVDLNLTLISWSPANQLINTLKQLGYFNRPLSSRFYLAIIAFLFLIQIYLLFSRFIHRAKLKKLFLLAGIVVLIASLTYPFLSSDIFTYLFNSKIIWHYQQNPYLHSPQEFAPDHWLRFTHWTHKTTPYGPIWLIYALVPAAFSFSRFILNFYGLKLLNGLIFFMTGWLIFKIIKKDRRVFVFWFFNPFLLIELLVNAHNDLLMIALFFLALYCQQKKKSILALVTLLSSVAVKFVSALAWPLIFFKKRFLWATLFVFCLLLTFAWQVDRFQPWYFTWAFFAFPLMEMNNFSWLTVFTFQAFLLIFKYYPFLATGSWEGTGFFLLFRVLLVALAFFFLSSLLNPEKLINSLNRKS